MKDSDDTTEHDHSLISIVMSGKTYTNAKFSPVIKDLSKCERSLTSRFVINTNPIS